MKKFSIVFLTLCLSTSLFASDNLKWIIEAGANISRVKSYDFKNMTSFRVGGKVDYILPQTRNSSFYVSTGLFLVNKGAKTNDFKNIKINSYYLDIPVHFGFRQTLSNDFTLFQEVGPYFAIGLLGKSKQEEYQYQHENGQTITVEETKFQTFDHFKRFDFGIGLKVGVEYDELVQISCGVDWGIIKASKKSDILDMSKGQVLSVYVSLGYVF